MAKIKVKNPEGVNKNVKTISINGEETKDKYIPLIDDNKEYSVEIVLGEEGLKI